MKNPNIIIKTAINIIIIILCLSIVYSEDEWTQNDCQNDFTACMDQDISTAFETDPQKVFEEDPDKIFEEDPDLAIEYLQNNPDELSRNPELIDKAYSEKPNEMLVLVENQMRSGKLINEVNSNPEIKTAWFNEKGVTDKGASIATYDGNYITTSGVDGVKFNPDEYIGLEMSVLESGKLVLEGQGINGKVEMSQGNIEFNNGIFKVDSGIISINGNIEGSIMEASQNSRVIINGIEYRSTNKMTISTVDNFATVRGQEVEMYLNTNKLGEFTGIAATDINNNIILSLDSKETTFKRFFNSKHARTYKTYDKTQVSTGSCSLKNCILEKAGELIVNAGSDRGYDIELLTNEKLLITKGNINGFAKVGIHARNPDKPFGEYTLTEEGIYHKNKLDGFENIDIVAEYSGEINVFIGGKENRKSFVIPKDTDRATKNELIKFLRLDDNDFEKVNFDRTGKTPTQYIQSILEQLNIRNDFAFRKELFKLLKDDQNYDYKGSDEENGEIFPSFIDDFTDDLKLTLGTGASFENIDLPNARKVATKCSEGNKCKVGNYAYETRKASKTAEMYYCAEDDECFIPNGEEGLRVVEKDGELYFVEAGSGGGDCRYTTYSDIEANCGVIKTSVSQFSTANIDKSSNKNWDDMSQSAGFLPSISGLSYEKFDDDETLFRKGGFSGISGSLCMRTVREIADENGLEIPTPADGVVDAWQLSTHPNSILADDMSKGFDLREEIESGNIKKGYVLITYEPKSKYNPPYSDSPLDGQSRDGTPITSTSCSAGGQCGTHVLVYAGKDKNGEPRFIHQYGETFYVEESGPRAGWTIDKIRSIGQIPRGYYPTY